MASNSKNLAELLNSDVTLTTTDIADGAVSTAKLADGAVTGGKVGFATGRRNLIINGAMQVAQRGTSFTGVSTGTYQLDRWKSLFSGVVSVGVATVSQSTDAPDGFSHSYKLEVTTADTSLDPWAEYVFQQRFEGQNLVSLKKGTAAAESVTVSFWVKSNVVDTYTLEILDNTNGSRHINKSYTIDTANTWEYKTITFEGDTAFALNYNNNLSLEVNWGLGAGTNFTSSGSLQTSWGSLSQTRRKVGQVNVFANTSNTWQITGVQMEVGTTATPFEHISYAEQLRACQRYYIQGGGPAYADLLGGQGFNITTTLCSMKTYLPVVMRAQPTFSYTGTPRVQNGQSGYALSNLTGGFPSGNEGKVNMFNMTGTSSGLTLYQPMNLDANVGGGIVKLDAEL